MADPENTGDIISLSSPESILWIPQEWLVDVSRERDVQYGLLCLLSDANASQSCIGVKKWMDIFNINFILIVKVHVDGVFLLLAAKGCSL